MKKEDIKELTDIELEAAIKVSYGNLAKMRLSHSVNPLENPMGLRNSRRELARMITEIKNRKMEKEQKQQ